MNKELGTYFVKMELVGGDGCFYRWETGARYTNGTESCSPLDADRMQCGYDNEQELFEGIEFMFTEGNYSCDCNRRLFLARAHQQDDPGDGEDNPCGDTMILERLTAIRPDGSEVILYETP